MTITIRGKEYKSRFFSLLVLAKAAKLEEKMGDAEKDLTDGANEEKYKKAWNDYCALILEGDVSDLAIDKLTAWEAKDLLGFFTSAVSEATRKPSDGKESLKNSETKNNPAQG